MLHPDGRPYEVDEWPLTRSIRDGEEVRGEEIVHLLGDGTKLWSRYDSFPIYDDEEEGRWVGELNLRHFRTGEPIPVLWDVFRLYDPDTGGMGIRGMVERARAIGGDLEIESEQGQGKKVRFEMPLRTREQDEPEGGSGAAEPEEVVRVLLVEDHAAVREAIAVTFQREQDFEVVAQASSLEQARGMLDEIDVAVVDLGLPDGYGGDLIRDLREANPRAQAPLLSASLQREEIARAVEAGAQQGS
jgi:CheY-like chemotaxis protein